MASKEAGVGSEEEGETEDPWLARFDVDNSFGIIVESEQSFWSFGYYRVPLSFCQNPQLSNGLV